MREVYVCNISPYGPADEEPLVAPTMNFGQPENGPRNAVTDQKGHGPAPSPWNAGQATTGGETPLLAPTWDSY